MKAVKPVRLKLIVFAFLAIFSTTLTIPLIHPQKAVAADPRINLNCIQNATLKYLTRAHIEADFCGTKIIFFDKDIGDEDYVWSAQNYDTCSDETFIAGTASAETPAGQRNLEINQPLGISMWYRSTANGSQCQLADINVPVSRIADRPNANIEYARTSGGTVDRVDGWGDGVFVAGDGAGNYVRKSERNDPCPDIIHANGAGQYEMYELTENSHGNGQALPSSEWAKIGMPGNPNGCEYDKKVTGPNIEWYRGGAGIYGNRNYALGPVGTLVDMDGGNNGGGVVAGGTSAPSGGAAGGGGINFDCEVKVYNPLTWIICPVIELLQGFINWLDEQIEDLLRINPDFLDTSELTGRSFFSAWSSVRTIALVLLLIITLIMVISQAIAVGPFDAYTVKKVLPRIIVAAIAIALSWNLMVLANNMVNTVGTSIRGVIQLPFRGLPLPTLGMGATGIFSVGIGLAFLNTSLLALGSFLLTAAVATLIAYTVLLLRQIVVMLLIMLAPLGIVMYILPNTQKLWKLWWESYSKALLMFPFIIAFIAVGRVFARATYATTSGHLGQIIAFMAYFLPYLLLPATLRFAGGALSTIGGFVNDRSKGVFDRGREFRKGERAKTKSLNASGERFNRSNFFARKYNQYTEGTATRKQLGVKGRFGFGEAGQQKQAALIAINRGVATQEAGKNPQVEILGQRDDDGNQILGNSGGTESGGREARDDLHAMWRETAQKKAIADFAAGEKDPDTGVARTSADLTDMEEERLQSRADRAYSAAAAVGFTRSNAEAAFIGAAQNKNRAIDPGRFDVLQRGVTRLAGDNPAYAQQVAYGAQFFARGAGRTDLGGDWTKPNVQATVAEADQADADAARSTRAADQASSDARAAHAAGRPAEEARHLAEATRHLADAGRSRNLATERRGAAEKMVFYDSVKRTGVGSIVQGHSASTEKAREVMVDDMASPEVAVRMQAGTLAAELSGQLAGATGDAKENIVAALTDLGVDFSRTERVKTTRVAGVDAATGQQIHEEVEVDRGVSVEQQITNLVNTGDAGTAAAPAPGVVTIADLQGASRTWGSAPLGEREVTPPTSDRRLKHNIRPLAMVGDIQLYKFQYIWSNVEYVGVMAQDLLDSHPEAVITGTDGFYRVNYHILGLEFQTYKEWIKNKKFVAINKY